MIGITYQITSKFPMYPLASVQVDIENAFKKSGGEIKNLPKVPKFIGGDIDFMLIIIQKRYSDLTIF